MTGTDNGAGAARGGRVGGTAGSTADAAQWSLKEDFLDAVRARLRPGQAVLVMEAEESMTAPIDQAVRRHDGGIHRSLVDR